MRNRTLQLRGISRSIITAAAALALSAGVTLAQRADRGGDRPPAGDAAPDNGPGGGPGGAPDRRGGQTPVDLIGVVQSYNLGERGIPDALMIKTGDKISQVNCGPELGMILSQATPIGDQVKISAIAGPAGADHAVYRLISLTNSKGRQLGGAGARDGKSVHVDAIVKQLNYGRDGEVNGAILENGDLVHVPADAAQQLKLAAGQKLSIDGQAHETPLGKNVIQAQKVNGTEIAAADDAGRGGPPDDQGPPRQGGRDQRDGGADNGPRSRRPARGDNGPDAGGPLGADNQQNPGGRPARGARAGGPPPADNAGGQDGPPRGGSRAGGPPQGDDQGPPPSQ